MNIELSETENHGVAFMMRYKANAVNRTERSSRARPNHPHPPRHAIPP